MKKQIVLAALLSVTAVTATTAWATENSSGYYLGLTAGQGVTAPSNTITTIPHGTWVLPITFEQGQAGIGQKWHHAQDDQGGNDD